MIDDVWLPAALRYGISMDVFWNLNPKYMYMYQKEYIREKEEQIKLMDISAYYNGMYVQQAIAACFSKNAKYPKKPLLFEKEFIKSEQFEEQELTEEQKIDYQKQLLMQLQIMQSNFESGKK